MNGYSSDELLINCYPNHSEKVKIAKIGMLKLARSCIAFNHHTTLKPRNNNQKMGYIYSFSASVNLTRTKQTTMMTSRTTEDINPRLDQLDSLILILWPLSIVISVIGAAVITPFIYKRQMIQLINTVMDNVDTTTNHQHSQTDTTYRTIEIQTSLRMIPDEPLYSCPLPPKKVPHSPPINFKLFQNQPSTSTPLTTSSTRFNLKDQSIQEKSISINYSSESSSR